MAETTTISIIIEAIDRASDEIKKVANQFKNMGNFGGKKLDTPDFVGPMQREMSKVKATVDNSVNGINRQIRTIGSEQPRGLSRITAGIKSAFSSITGITSRTQSELDAVNFRRASQNIVNDVSVAQQKLNSLKAPNAPNMMGKVKIHPVSIDTSAAQARLDSLSFDKAKNNIISGVNASQNAIDGMGKSQGSMAQNYNKFMNRMQRQQDISATASNLTRPASVLYETLKKPVAIAMEFEQAMANVGSISINGAKGSEEYESQLAQLTAKARELGASTAFSSVSVAEGMLELGAAGFNTNQILKATPGLLATAAASGAGLAATAEISAGIMNSYKMAPEKIGYVGDVLAKTSNVSAAGFADLGESMKYVAPIANTAGISLEKLSAMTAILANQQIKGSQAGTTLRAMVMRLTAPNERVEDILGQLKGYGLDSDKILSTAKDFKEFFKKNEIDPEKFWEGGIELTATQTDEFGKVSKNLRDYESILTDVAERVNMIPDQVERGKIIKGLFGEEPAAGADILLKSMLGGAKSEWNRMSAEFSPDKLMGSAQEVAEKRMATFAGLVEETSGSIEDLGISIGNAIIPVFASILHFINPIVDGINNFIQTNLQLTTNIMSVVVGFVIFMGVLGAVGTIFATVTAGFAVLAFTIGMILSPIGAAVAAFALLGAAVNKYWQPISAFFTGFSQGFSDAFGPIGEAFAPLIAVFSPLISLFQGLGEPIAFAAEQLQYFSDIGMMVGSTIGQLAKQGIAVLADALSQVGMFLSNAFNSIDFSGIFNGLMSGLAVFWNAIAPIKTTLVDAFNGINLDSVFSSLSARFSTMWGVITTTFQSLSTFISGISLDPVFAGVDAGIAVFTNAINQVKSVLSSAFQVILAFFGGIAVGLKMTFGSIAPIFQPLFSLFERVKAGISSFSLSSIDFSPLQTGIDSVKQGFSSVITFISSLIEKIKGLFTDMTGISFDSLLGKSFAHGINIGASIGQGITNAISSIKSGIAAINSGLAILKTASNSFISGFTDGFKEVFGVYRVFGMFGSLGARFDPLVAAFERLKAAFSDLGVFSGLSNLFAPIQGLFSSFGSFSGDTSFLTIFSDIGTAISDFFQDTEKLYEIGSSIGNVFGSIGVSLVSGVTAIINGIASVIEFFAAGGIREKITGAFQGIGEWISGQFNNFDGSGLLSAFASGISASAQAIWNAIVSVFQWIRGLFPSSDAQYGPLSTLSESGRALLATFAEGIASSAGAVFSALVAVFSPVLQYLSGLFDGVDLTSVFASIPAKLSSAMSTAKQFLTGFFQGFSQGFGGSFSGLFSASQGFFSAIGRIFSRVKSILVDFFSSILGGNSQVQQSFSALSSGLSFGETIGKGASMVVTAITTVIRVVTILMNLLASGNLTFAISSFFSELGIDLGPIVTSVMSQLEGLGRMVLDFFASIFGKGVFNYPALIALGMSIMNVGSKVPLLAPLINFLQNIGQNLIKLTFDVLRFLTVFLDFTTAIRNAGALSVGGFVGLIYLAYRYREELMLAWQATQLLVADLMNLDFNSFADADFSLLTDAFRQLYDDAQAFFEGTFVGDLLNSLENLVVKLMGWGQQLASFWNNYRSVAIAAAIGIVAAITAAFLKLRQAMNLSQMMKDCKNNPLLKCMLPDDKELKKRLKAGKRGFELIKTPCPPDCDETDKLGKIKKDAFKLKMKAQVIDCDPCLDLEQKIKNITDKVEVIERGGREKSKKGWRTWGSSIAAGVKSVYGKIKEYADIAKFTGSMKRDTGSENQREIMRRTRELADKMSKERGDNTKEQRRKTFREAQSIITKMAAGTRTLLQSIVAGSMTDAVNALKRSWDRMAAFASSATAKIRQSFANLPGQISGLMSRIKGSQAFNGLVQAASAAGARIRQSFAQLSTQLAGVMGKLQSETGRKWAKRAALGAGIAAAGYALFSSDDASASELSETDRGGGKKPVAGAPAAPPMSFTENVTQMATQGFEKAKAIFEQIKTWVSENLEMAIMGGMMILETGILGGLMPIIMSVGGVLAAGFAGWKIGEWLYNSFAPVQEVAISVVGTIVEAFNGIAIAYNNVVAWTSNAISVISSLPAQVSVIYENLISLVSTKIEWVMTTISTVMTKIGAMFSNLLSTISSNVAQIPTILGNALVSAVNVIGSYVSQFSSAGVSLIQGIVSGIASMGNAVVAEIMNIGSRAATAVKDMASNIASTISSGVGSAFGGLKDSISSGFEAAANLLPHSDAKEGPFSTLTESGQSIMTTMAGGVQNATPQLTDSMNSAFANANDQILYPKVTPAMPTGMGDFDLLNLDNQNTTNDLGRIISSNTENLKILDSTMRSFIGAVANVQQPLQSGVPSLDVPVMSSPVQESIQPPMASPGPVTSGGKVSADQKYKTVTNEVADALKSASSKYNYSLLELSRMASLESSFDANVKNKEGYMGLFQFKGAASKETGISGREFDPKASAEAAIKYWQINQKVLDKNAGGWRQTQSQMGIGDGLAAWMAHNQGAGGLSKIFKTLTTGVDHLGPTITRNIRNNLVGGKGKHLSGVELAKQYMTGWQQKWEKLPLPAQFKDEFQQGMAQPSVTSAGLSPATVNPSMGSSGGSSSLVPTVKDIGIGSLGDVATQALQKGVKYKLGAKNIEMGQIDCSGFVHTITKTAFDKINKATGKTVFDKSDFSMLNDSSHNIIQRVSDATGTLVDTKKSGFAGFKDQLKEGMMIGIDHGDKGWDRGRVKKGSQIDTNIDHIVQVIRDKATGKLQITESRGGKGVDITDFDKWMAKNQKNRMFATDPFALASQEMKETTAALNSTGNTLAKVETPLSTVPKPTWEEVAKPEAIKQPPILESPKPTWEEVATSATIKMPPILETPPIEPVQPIQPVMPEVIRPEPQPAMGSFPSLNKLLPSLGLGSPGKMAQVLMGNQDIGSLITNDLLSASDDMLNGLMYPQKTLTPPPFIPQSITAAETLPTMPALTPEMSPALNMPQNVWDQIATPTLPTPPTTVSSPAIPSLGMPTATTPPAVQTPPATASATPSATQGGGANITFGDIVININGGGGGQGENQYDVAKLGDMIREQLGTVMNEQMRRSMFDI